MIGDKIIEEFETDDALVEVVARRDDPPLFEMSPATVTRLVQALLALRKGDGA